MKLFGLDIGSSLVKIAQVEKSGKDLTLSHFGWVANPLGVVDYGNEVEQKKLAEEVKKLVKESGVEGRQVVVSLPESQIYTRILEMPVLSQTELASAINWEAEQYIPVPIADVNLSWEILDKPKGALGSKKMLVFLVAAPKKLIDNQVRFLEIVGLEPVAVETSSVALTRMIPEQENVLMIMQIGWKTSSLVIVDKGILVFTYSLNTASEALTRSIVQELKLDFYQAEEYRRSYGFEKEALEGKVALAMKLVFDELGAEAKRAIEFYRSKSEGKIVSRIMLSGGGVLTPGLSSQLAEYLGSEVAPLNPLAQLVVSKEKGWPKELLSISPLMSEVIGLAMREV